MPAGIEIIGSSGSYIVDANLATPSRVSSGAATTVTNTTTQLGSSEVSISWTATSSAAPICVLRPPAGAACWQISCVASGSAYTWKYICAGAVGTSIPYWIFDRPTSSPDNFGLEMYDSGGNRVYHSGVFPMRIVTPFINADIGIILAGNTNSNQDYTFTAGRTYGAFFARPCGYRKYAAAGGGNFNLRGYNNGFEGLTNGLRTMSILHSSVGPTASPNYSLEREWLTRLIIPVDITDY